MVTQQRKTFTVPEGSDAVRDSDGRATGEVIVPATAGDGSHYEKIQGAELLAEAAAEPTMDRYLDGSPKLLTDKDWEEFVTVLQRKRALFITAEQKRKEPKIEGEDE